MVCLSSCTVVKDPVSVSYVDINTGIRAGRDVDIKLGNDEKQKEIATRLSKAMELEPPTTAPSAPTPTIKAEMCAKYIPPNLPPIPKMTAKQVEEISKSTGEQYSEALLIQIERVYKYAKLAQDANAKALEQHKKSCRMVTVQ